MAGFDWNKYSKVDAKADATQPSGGSGFDWGKYEKADSGHGVLDTLFKVGNVIDSYTGAPTRAAVGKLVDRDPVGAVKAGWNQLGEDPTKAPTGKDLAKRFGLSDQTKIFPQGIEDLAKEYDASKLLPDSVGNVIRKIRPDNVTPAGAAGLGLELALDPSNILPVTRIAKYGTKAAKIGAEAAVEGAKLLPGAKVVGTTAEVVKDSVNNTAAALKKMFTPAQAKDFPELAEIAKRHGIDPSMLPEAVEFGDGSFISRAARNRAEGVLGEPHLKKFESALESVRDATEKKVAEIGGGSIPSPVEAGEMIRKGFDEGVDHTFNSLGMTHNKVIEAIPGLTLSPEAAEKISSKLDGIERWAKGRAERGFTNAQRAQAEQVLRAVEAARAGNGSYKQTAETLRDIGEVAFKSQNILADVPPDIAKFRDLYHTINDGLIDTVRQAAGAPVAEELLESNKKITELMGDKSVVSGIIGNKNLAPEKVFTALVEQGDTRKIQALKNILPPETFQKLKGAFLDSQIKRAADDTFTFKSLQNSLRNKKNVLGELLEPSEINELSDLIRLGDRFGHPVLSTSGTGASNLFSNITEGIRSGLESDTVIGVLKDQARNRSAKAASIAAQAEAKPLLSGAAISDMAAPIADAVVRGDQRLKTAADKFKTVATLSPNFSKTLAIHSRPEKQTDSGSTGSSQNQGRGADKWASDGFDKLTAHGAQGLDRDALLKDPKTKELLIQASSLKPGSKAMEAVLTRIKSRTGKDTK